MSYRRQYYLDNWAKIRYEQKLRREANLGRYREVSLLSWRRWREANPVKYRAIKFARNHFPLGDCCEFCGSTVGLVRFLVEYSVPVGFVVTVCRLCRGFARESLRERN